tara:strand:- start:39 stop:218 length:180 start_codon:yes stop_codon:yes gene_type:complete
MKTTQIEKSQTFALNFASMLALQAALNELTIGVHLKDTKDQLEKTILQAVEAHPQPAEA